MTTRTKILVVEDEPVVAVDLRNSLRFLGYDVVGIAKNGQEALALVEEKRPNLVLMDIVLKGKMSGVDVTKELNKHREVPVVYLTSHTDDQTLEEAKMTEPFGFLVKPFEDIELQTAVEMALHKFKMEKQLRDNATRLTTTFRSLGDGVIVADKRLNITFINPYVIMLSGRTQKDMVGKKLTEFFRIIKGKEGKTLETMAREVLADGQLIELVDSLQLISSAGREIHIDASLAPVKEDSGEINGVVLVFHDIMQRKLAEEALRRSEKRYRELFEHSHDAIYIMARSGDIVLTNPAMQKMFGYSQSEMVSMNIRDLFPEEGIWDELEKRIVYKGDIADVQVRMKTKDGTLRDCLINTITRKAGDGLVIGYQGIIRDITESLKAAAALKRSETRYRLLAENIYDIIWIMDQDLRFTFVTPSVSNILGYSIEEFLALDIKDLCTKESTALALDFFNNFLIKASKTEPDDENRVMEIEFYSKGGDRVWMSVSLSKFKVDDEEPVGLIGVAHDITKRIMAETEKGIIQEQLLQAQKMEAIGILAGGVAHDFNNLLTVIQGSTDLAMLRLEEKDPLFTELDEINKASVRAAELTSQLLLFSRKKPMRLTTLNLNKIIEDLLKMLHRLIGEDVGISMDIEEPVWQISADRSNMEQVIMNLSVNARDAMPEGGKFTIATHNVEIDEANCQNCPEAKMGKYVRLTVADTGTGMDEETRQRIFEPFYSTKGTGKGTGLGLSVVYGIVKQHHGWIEVESEQGRGTAFRLYFPSCEDVGDDEKHDQRYIGKYKSNGERILLVEDEVGVRQFATKALVEYGYEVITAGSVSEAVHQFERHADSLHLILSDVVLPDGTGIELADEFRRSHPDLPILLSSGYTDHKSQWTEIQEKGYSYLQKPYTVYKLLKTLTEILHPSEKAPS